MEGPQIFHHNLHISYPRFNSKAKPGHRTGDMDDGDAAAGAQILHHTLHTSLIPVSTPASEPQLQTSGDTTPCRMTGLTLHSHVHYKEV